MFIPPPPPIHQSKMFEFILLWIITVSSQPTLNYKSDSDGENPVSNMASFHIDDREDFKDESLYTFCGSCKNHVMTMVTYRVGKMTIVFAAALCLLGCLGGCCLVPFLWKRFQDVEHVCPNCQLKLGKYRRPTKNICCKVRLTQLHSHVLWGGVGRWTPDDSICIREMWFYPKTKTRKQESNLWPFDY